MEEDPEERDAHRELIDNVNDTLLYKEEQVEHQKRLSEVCEKNVEEAKQGPGAYVSLSERLGNKLVRNRSLYAITYRLWSPRSSERDRGVVGVTFELVRARSRGHTAGRHRLRTASALATFA